MVIAVPVSVYIANTRSKKAMEITIGNAEDKAREIIDEAIKAADAKKREASLEVKEETIKARHDFEKETKERRAELQKYEQRVLSKEETVEKKATTLERKEQSLASKEKNIETEKAQLQELQAKHLQELERISGLTSDQAKEQLLSAVKEDVKHETAMYVKEMETRAKEDARKKAKEYVVTAIQKCAVDHVAETTISLVQLPNDEMKGRIIGREGRNIRSIENATGVELIIDDTPEAVVLSSFNPVRREIARIALEKLIVDGRIHPARIEEMVEKATKEVETMMREEGEAATLELGVHGIHPELVRLLGRMKFRTSYGQNALKHSMEVAQLSGLLAAEIGVDVRMAKRAGLLHDIGKSIDHEVEGSHVELGVNLCKKYKENPIVINAVASHHGDEEPESLIACLVQAADAISAARPGARSETLESYTTRLKQLEEIADSFQGVDKTFAIQAGREIRVMVVPEQISDDDMILLARDISNQIEENLDYPGQIKVNVIRESRVVDYAK
nr:ribonuclease Y [Anaerostipes sp. Marseille-Q3525]